MALKRNGRWDFKKLNCYVFYENNKGKVIKEFRCPHHLVLHDKHWLFMMSDPNYLCL